MNLTNVFIVLHAFPLFASAQTQTRAQGDDASRRRLSTYQAYPHGCPAGTSPITTESECKTAWGQNLFPGAGYSTITSQFESCRCSWHSVQNRVRFNNGSCSQGSYSQHRRAICKVNPPTAPPTVMPTDPPTTRPSTASPTTGSTTIKNAGKGCWGQCSKTPGDCSYCGTGQCCRAVDYRNQVPGCELAEHAVGARCGAWRGGGFPSLMNVGLPCIGKCDKQPGDCDYCGTAGQCCRPFDGEQCVPGCELTSEDSWMGPGSQCGEFKDPSAAPVHCTPTP